MNLSKEQCNELVLKARSGDDAAWSFLFEAHLSQIVSLGHKYKIDPLDAEAEGLIKFYAAVQTFNPGSAHFWVYLRGLLSNRFNDMTARKAEWCRSTSLEAMLEKRWDAGFEPAEEDATGPDRIALIHRAETEKLLMQKAGEKTLHCFEQFLNARRSSRAISKSCLREIRWLVGLPSDYPVLIDDGTTALMVDDFYLLGLKVLRCLSDDPAWNEIPLRLKESPMLIKSVRNHLKHCVSLLPSEEV